MDTKTENLQVCDPANTAFFILYQAIKIVDLDKLKLLFKNKPFVTAPLIKTGLLAGYTALHIACMEGSLCLVKMLIEEFDVDVNVTANNGIQPIHLAVLLDYPEILEFLVQTNKNVDAEIEEEMVIQHGKNNRVWCPDFGNKMTLLTYSVLSGQKTCIHRLLKLKANKNIISLKNKTLMMYAIERNLKIASTLALYHIDRKIINHRDNDGRHVIHYLLHLSSDRIVRYSLVESTDKSSITSYLLQKLIQKGADIYALINDDPDTLLLNMAAYRASLSILKVLLPASDSISQSKALYFATLPVQDDHTEQGPCLYNLYKQHDELSKRREQCVELILNDLVYRLTFGLAVPDGEEKLMEKLIQQDTTFAKIVRSYKEIFMNIAFQFHEIQYGNNKRISYYDLISLSADSKKLQKILKEENFVSNLNELYLLPEYYDYFKFLLQRRIKKVVTRFELLEKLKTVPQLTIAIPLPYELVLLIIEFLDNYDMKAFIDAFYTI